MERFAVIDTETNWMDAVMSIGTVVADAETFEIIDSRYHILPAACAWGGMYADVLYWEDATEPLECSRRAAMADLKDWLDAYGVEDLYAYNAGFDWNHLPELAEYRWYDIMRMAAYRQYNNRIPECAECFKTGRLKRGYGVEAMLRLLSGRQDYREVHNAVCDARDELKLMRLLGRDPETYIRLNE